MATKALRDAWSKFFSTGDDAALEQAFIAASEQVYETCYSELRSNEVAVEACQQALFEFLCLCRGGGILPDDPDEELRRLAKRCSERSKYHQHWEQQHFKPVEVLQRTIGVAPTAGDLVLEHEEHEALCVLISLLDDADQRLITMYYFWGLDQSRIATELGVSRSRVSHRLAEATEKLRRMAEERRFVDAR